MVPANQIPAWTSKTFINLSRAGLMLIAYSLALPTAHARTWTNPDGKEADMSKPVQVFIHMGQSNMPGFGKVPGD